MGHSNEYTIYPFSGERDKVPTVDVILDLYGLSETIWTDFNGMIISHPIRDMGPPTGPIGETIDQILYLIRSGKKVGVCCFGGHGRTGTILSALLTNLEPEVEDLIGTLRQRYCQKAVETASQEEWVSHYSGKPNLSYFKPTAQLSYGYEADLYDTGQLSGQYLEDDGTADIELADQTITPIVASNQETEDWLEAQGCEHCGYCQKWIPQEIMFYSPDYEDYTCLFPDQCEGFQAVVPKEVEGALDFLSSES